jgi:hypothetical protein
MHSNANTIVRQNYNFVIVATFCNNVAVHVPGPAIIFSILNSASTFPYSVIFNFLLSRQEAHSATKETPLILSGPNLITKTLMLGFKQRSPKFLILGFLYEFKKKSYVGTMSISLHQ